MQQESTPYAIEVEVTPRFLADQSEPEAGRYVFAYTIRIHNRGSVAARLVSRHWHITDGNGRTEEVHGDGVVGEQPWLDPGDDYEYTSGVVLETGDGAMQGRYDMLAADGTRFDAPIAPFLLTVPRTLH
ncbi:Co2+/Mg2+ efflux protein ApaG [Pseudoxanthomonas koreensis]|uniref:Co2+/Mg2+ efflux protein ApaG n=1 Tax=Pseudoxanthomonas koreensis TaxID=266061 RepID=UPI0013908B1B|nr:Co2+/Mg2+ efflux protein ApaG [Pseudoxanthomonas koreensis]KAF1688897.1 Co2+/Mg2+ efflux protein ApaG [Pseudoxanthomonas koreensis]